MATGESPFSPDSTVDSLDSTADRSSSVVLASIVLICLSVLAVVLRLWSRKLVKVNLLCSDWILVVGLVFTIGFSVLEIVAAQHGLGKHILRNKIEDDILLLQLLFAEDILYTIALTSTKLSILLLYRTIFPTSPTPAFRLAGYVIAFLCLAWGISGVCVGIFSCTPISDYWNIFKPVKHCINQEEWYKGTGIANVITDALILALPVVSVWQLQLSWKQKLSVSALFLLGGFVIVASIIRLVVLVSMSQSDITWTYYGVAMWSVIEVNIAVISTCLPTMRPLLLAAAPWFTRLGLSLRSFVPGGREKGYKSATSDASRQRPKARARAGAMPAYASDELAESLQGYPYCQTKVESECVGKESKRTPRRVQSDEEMAELVPVQPPPLEGGIMVQRDLVQTWNRADLI